MTPSVAFLLMGIAMTDNHQSLDVFRYDTMSKCLSDVAKIKSAPGYKAKEYAVVVPPHCTNVQPEWWRK